MVHAELQSAVKLKKLPAFGGCLLVLARGGEWSQDIFAVFDWPWAEKDLDRPAWILCRIRKPSFAACAFEGSVKYHMVECMNRRAGCSWSAELDYLSIEVLSREYFT
ncbi:hypothetical protein TWF132_001806 [Orbilia oligospora]|nr:hypothetical protein TWF132_001806 [Orbilia oligospora]